MTEKSRDCGVSWLAANLAVGLCTLNKNVNVGFGSAKELKIDRSGDPDSLFYKLRLVIEHLPPEFRAGCDLQKHSAHMRLYFPQTGSSIVGEAGSNIGRGGRTTLFFVDEAAHLEHPELIEASLSSNTDCRIDISSVRGMTNPFAIKRHTGRIKVFTFSWRDDPRKGDAWYARQEELLDPVTLAAEVNIDYRASVQGSLIPSVWIADAIGAHLKLGIKPTGLRHGGLDLADEGADRCAFAGRHGVLLEHLQSWSGKGSDLFASVQRAFGIADAHDYPSLSYDGDGLGSSARGDAIRINEERRAAGKVPIQDEAFRGSASPADPNGKVPGTQRINLDMFANAKAQAYYALRQRFQQTWRAISKGMAVDPDSIISIHSDLPELAQLVNELVQPTYSLNAAGKILVDKTPAGARSPNLADAVMIAFAPGTRALRLETWHRMDQRLRGTIP